MNCKIAMIMALMGLSSVLICNAESISIEQPNQVVYEVSQDNAEILRGRGGHGNHHGGGHGGGGHGGGGHGGGGHGGGSHGGGGHHGGGHGHHHGHGGWGYAEAVYPDANGQLGNYVIVD